MKTPFTRFTSKASKASLKPSKNIGLFVTKELNEFLNLYAASQRISKSAVVRNILVEWYEETSHNIEPILNDLRLYIQHEWHLAKTLNKIQLEKQITFEDFANNIRSTFHSKGVPKKIIDLLLNEMTI